MAKDKANDKMTSKSSKKSLSTKKKTSIESNKNIAKNVVTKARIRKTETVKERNTKLARKTATKKYKRGKHKRLKKILGMLKPFKKPANILLWPFRTKPVKFIFKIIGRILWPMYFRNSWKEIRQVRWLTWRETIKLSIAVLVFTIVFTASAAGLDWVFDKMIKRIVFRS